MMNFQKYIKTSNILFFVSFIIFLTGCTKETPHKKYVAKVNNSYLTEEELDAITDSSSNELLFRSEIIRNWINKELLFQEAKKQGILNEKEYKRILGDSQKELAGSLLLKNFFENEKNKTTYSEVENYYEKNLDEFKLFYNSYLLNRINFNNEDNAVQFRSDVLKDKWQNAMLHFKNDTSVISQNENQLLYEYEIQPASLLRIMKELNPDEVSIVLKNDENNYTLVQVLQKFNKGTTPPLEYIYSEVEKRYMVKKKELTIKGYIKELYSKNEIEVKN